MTTFRGKNDNYIIDEEYSKKLAYLLIALLNLLVMLAIIFFVHPQYETNDDSAIIAIVSGAYGNCDPHMVFSNYVLGLLLSGLYSLVPAVPWYAVLYYLLMYVSFTSLSCLLWQRARHKIISSVLLVCLCVLSFECYWTPSFTKTSAIVGVTGIILIADSLKYKKFNLPKVILGIILAVFSYLIRGTEFLSVAAITSGIFIYVIFDFVEGHSAAEIKTQIIRGVACALALFSMIGAVMVINSSAYSSDEWKNYEKFNKLRSELMDFGWPSYAQNKELYDSLGIDEQALSLYKNWDFYDTEKLTVDSMQKLVDAKPKNTFTVANFLRKSFDCITALSKYKILYFIFIELFVLVMALSKIDKKKLFTMGYLLLSCTGLFIYLIVMGRYRLNRVNFGLLLSMAAVLLYIICESDMVIPKIKNIIAILTAVSYTFFVVSPIYTYFFNTSAYKERVKYHDCLEEIAKDKAAFYFTDVGTVSFYNRYYAFDVIPKNSSYNCISLGGWTVNLPTKNDLLNAYSIKNPFRDLIEKKNFYLIDKGNIELIYEYIKRNYAPDAIYEKVYELGNFNIYKFSVGNGEAPVEPTTPVVPEPGVTVDPNEENPVTDPNIVDTPENPGNDAVVDNPVDDAVVENPENDAVVTDDAIVAAAGEAVPEDEVVAEDEVGTIDADGAVEAIVEGEGVEETTAPDNTEGMVTEETTADTAAGEVTNETTVDTNTATDSNPAENNENNGGL